MGKLNYATKSFIELRQLGLMVAIWLILLIGTDLVQMHLQAITPGYTFTANDTVTASKLNQATAGTIGNSEVQANMLGAASVTTAAIANNSLTASKFQNGSVPMSALTNFNTLPSTVTLDAPNQFVPLYNADTAQNEVATLSQIASAASFPSGVILPYSGVTPPTSWVLCNGGTIGNATSGGTLRANADTINLYTILWNGFANAQLAIQDSAGTATTRGASALLDFNANKRLPVPDLRGRALFGCDTMGTNAAGRIANTGFGGSSTVTNFDGTILGNAGGFDRHTQISAEVAAHTHNYDNTQIVQGGAGGATIVSGNGGGGVTGQVTGGGGNPMSILPPSYIIYFIIKL